MGLVSFRGDCQATGAGERSEKLDPHDGRGVIFDGWAADQW